MHIGKKSDTKRNSFNAALEATARIACCAVPRPLLSCMEEPKEVDADGDGFIAEEDCEPERGMHRKL